MMAMSGMMICSLTKLQLAIDPGKSGNGRSRSIRMSIDKHSVVPDDVV